MSTATPYPRVDRRREDPLLLDLGESPYMPVHLRDKKPAPLPAPSPAPATTTETYALASRVLTAFLNEPTARAHRIPAGHCDGRCDFR